MKTIEEFIQNESSSGILLVSLAFEDNSIFQYTDKLAILVGSFMSGMVGYLVLKAGKNK